MSNVISLECPACGRKFGIRKTSGTVHVTCPDCREQWDWPPPRRPKPKLDGRQKADRFLALISKWTNIVYRFAFSNRRFSGAHLIAAAAVGIVLGVFMGIVLTNRHRSLRFGKWNTPVPLGVAPAAVTAANPRTPGILAPTTNGLDNRIRVPTNFQDLVIPERR